MTTAVTASTSASVTLLVPPLSAIATCYINMALWLHREVYALA
jgi:hypothetical protein